MLDANDIQKISEIVSRAISENNKELREELHEDFMTIIESEVRPQLLLLAEGHEALLEKINRIEKNTEVEGRLDILENAVKKLNREVAELKKAQ
ncbi:MAG: hypothetical protein K6G66_04075 [Oscillospiraceae bacterium]|nr:hypothetical protein [Oscillospiraceae bacterium]